MAPYLQLTCKFTGVCKQVKPRVDLYRALDSVVMVVALGSKSIWVHVLPQDISTNRYVSDINPLTVEMSSIYITTVSRDTLSSCSAPVSGRTSSAKTVFEAKTGLMPFRHLLPRGNIQEVVVYEGFKRVIVIVAAVPYPLVPLQIREKVNGPPVHCLAGESKKMSVMVVRFAISR